MPTAGELREVLAASKASWSVTERLADGDQLDRYVTGATTERLVPSPDVPELDFSELLVAEPGNPYLLARRAERGFVPRSAVEELGLEWVWQPGGVTGEYRAPPTSVDWRNRWGWGWITGIRDQNGCMACWCFAAVALTEAMVRIEHCVWPCISEGDVHKGMGSLCCDCGSAENALEWIEDNGAADPGCYAWPVTPSGCQGCGGAGGGPYDAVAYTPTPDRAGRTVRIPLYTHVGSVNDQKDWLDTVGPLSTYFEVWTDFFGYGGGVYEKSTAPGNKAEGGHIMLVVGYDDTDGCWIVKNSWGPAWGVGGYCRIAYGECDIDAYAKAGLRNTNPDPWTKRRLHSGNMLESGNGTLHCNFEMLATDGGNGLRHRWRDGSSFNWHTASSFANDALVCPTLTATTFNRNFESVHLTNRFLLHHWFLDRDDGNWYDGGAFGPLDAAAVPGFMQSNDGAPGNFEVVVRRVDGRLNHWWRMNGPPWTWTDAGHFGNNVAHSGATLVQSQHGETGNFELVCVLDNGEMQHWVRDNDAGTDWQATGTFGSGVDSPPCMIEGQYGAEEDTDVGNFELCVAVRGEIQHWWRDNAAGTGWHHGATFGHDVQCVVSLLEGSFGFNLEVIALRTDRQLQHYWRDGAGWHEGVVIGGA